MVLRQFSTSSLEVLCTEERLDLLDSVDTLRLQGISHYISLPQIIVCAGGDIRSFVPGQKQHLHTHSTELVLRKSPHIGVRVSIAPHRSRSHVEQDTLSRFHDELAGFEGLPKLIDDAKAAMGPDHPHLTIVDLPGLIQSKTKLQSAANITHVQDAVQSYMKGPRSIILAVVSAENDFANQIVLRLARKANRSGHRTLGVITKPDILEGGFRLGWHVLKNMDTEKGTWSLCARREEEAKFFAKGIWGDLPPSQVELPSLIDDIQSKMDQSVKGFEKLGEPRTTLKEQRSYLLHISQYFQTLVKSGLDGSYNSPFFESAQLENGYQKRIRAVIQNLNEDFAQHIIENGHDRQICNGIEVNNTSDERLLITREEYLEHFTLYGLRLV
ncbi:P-loop containing nucleoside triphosphate hydrolase protein [Aspergillus pseudonomiae]|nr:P-loop containing nucleoside triphosphate hydrolase protein [Aspergillus pseudonomiae]